MAVDFNLLVEALADAIAEKVVARLDKHDTYTSQLSEASFTDKVTIANQVAGAMENKEFSVGDTVEVGGIKFTKHSDSPFPDEVVNSDAVVIPRAVLPSEGRAEREAVLTKRNVLTLRKLIAAAEDRATSDYDQKKPDLVKYILDFEALTGHLVDEEPQTTASSDYTEDEVPDDNSIEEAEAADDTDDEEEEELDRESALRLDLAELKAIAIENDIEPSALKGLDVDAVVDLLFGAEEEVVADEEPVEADDDDSEKEITLDDIADLSLGELKALAAQENIPFTREDTKDQKKFAEKIQRVLAEGPAV